MAFKNYLFKKPNHFIFVSIHLLRSFIIFKKRKKMYFYVYTEIMRESLQSIIYKYLNSYFLQFLAHIFRVKNYGDSPRI